MTTIANVKDSGFQDIQGLINIKIYVRVVINASFFLIRWWTLGHLETQQCSLSSTMLSAAKGDSIRLSQILESARKNIHSSCHLYKLALDAFRFASPETDPRSQTLLGVAFELGLQVIFEFIISLYFQCIFTWLCYVKFAGSNLKYRFPGVLFFIFGLLSPFF